MKKLVSMFLMVLMIISLFVGCGEKSGTKVDTERGDMEQGNSEMNSNLEIALTPEEFVEAYVVEFEVTPENWQKYFELVEIFENEETAQYPEHPNKDSYLQLKEGYFMFGDVTFDFSYHLSEIRVEFDSDGNILDREIIQDEDIEHSLTCSNGIAYYDNVYGYFEPTNGLYYECAYWETLRTHGNEQCMNARGKVYALQIPEDAWHEEDGQQVVYIEQYYEDGRPYAMEYANDEEGLGYLEGKARIGLESNKSEEVKGSITITWSGDEKDIITGNPYDLQVLLDGYIKDGTYIACDENGENYLDAQGNIVASVKKVEEQITVEFYDLTVDYTVSIENITPANGWEENTVITCNLPEVSDFDQWEHYYRGATGFWYFSFGIDNGIPVLVY